MIYVKDMLAVDVDRYMIAVMILRPYNITQLTLIMK